MGAISKVIVVILLLRVGAAFGQPNLLHNGDFEEQFCPTCFVQGPGEVEKLKYMHAAVGSPDLLAGNALAPLVKPPKTFNGYQYPQNGNNYIGIASGYFLLPNQITSEYLLYASPRELKANKLYRFTVHVNFANNSPNRSRFLQLSLASFDLRNYFADFNLFITLMDSLSDYAYSTQLYSDTLNWIAHSVEFRAKGDEKYFYLFLKNGADNIVSSDSIIKTFEETTVSYYFFDNMSLIELPDPENPEEEVSLELPNTFTPNADGENDAWHPRSRNFDYFELQVFNRYGTLVFQSQGEQVQWDGLTLSGEPAAEGVYFVHLTATDRYGEVHNEQETVHLFR